MANKEIRDILLGRIVRLDEELWAVAPAGTRFHFHGIRDGAGDVRLFGVTHCSRCYRMGGMEPAVAFSAAETALYTMGRPMQLASMPEEKACLYAPNWIAPVLLTLTQDGNDLLLTAYTGRSMLIGHLRCRIALWIFERRLPVGATCIEKNRKAHIEPEKTKKTGQRVAPKSRLPQKKKKAAPKRLKK